MDTASYVENFRNAVQARVYLACTGGGAGLQKLIWNVPGISSFLIGTSFPYEGGDTTDFLGFSPIKFCNEDTAVDLAIESYYRAWKPGSKFNIGIGLTAVVATKQVHRGTHRVYAASFSEKGCLTHTLEFDKGEGTQKREEDGKLCDLLGLNALLLAADLKPYPMTSFFTEHRDQLAHDRIMQYPYVDTHRQKHVKPPENSIFFPGNFNPPHFGHFGIADKVKEVQHEEPIFYMTVNPPHKPVIPNHELIQRSKLLAGRRLVFSEHDPLYIDKAKKHPGSSFIIGSDSVQRMLDPVWCPVEPRLNDFLQLDTKFYVFERVVNGKLLTLESLQIKERYQKLFRKLAGQWDISSTFVREQMAKSA